MDKRTPTQKSIVRHKLKEIDKKWAGAKVKTKVLNSFKKLK